ncbi:YbjO family protein [Entomohabitans teleogrylli]|uniref:YbjO family protein n=1 Tax=Entomohabitans teleogrylli TaxID=1384589 RepID=UPI00073D5A76|nr:YbjO family protein [Entomohabitans teleogrylli]
MDIIRKRSASHARLNTPTLVTIAAIAIVTVRCVDLLMLFNTLGPSGILDFIQRSIQTWALTLIFFASLVMLCVEVRCAFVIVRGRNWGRWVFLLTQVISGVYLWLASLGWGYPELFSIAGETSQEILHSLMVQKLPDLLILFLLFVPASSRRFFRLQ